VSDWSQQELLRQIRAGRREACEQFVRDHYAGVYRFLVHATRDAALAEDLTQETFAAAWRTIGRFEGKASLATWLHRIAYRKLLNAWRSRRRRDAGVARLALVREGEAYTSPLEWLMGDEQGRQLYEAVQSLAEGARLLIALHYFQELSFDEMADVLDEPVGTVKWKTSRALAQLKHLLAATIDHESAWEKPVERPDARIAGSEAAGPATAANSRDA
jgi:RNA polymerase sigma-70 factor (ECF subfamily)